MANETKALPLGAKCFRWRRELIWYGLFSGAACLIVVAGLVAAPYFKVGRAFAQSDSNEKLVVVCLGLFTAMGALSAFLTSWCASKSRLIFLPDAVRQDGVGRTMTIEWHALTEVIWKEAGAAIHQVVLRSPTRRLRIDLSPYASADRLEIVAKIRECLPMQVRQQGLPPEPANPAGQSDVNTNCDQKARPEVCEETLATFLAAPAPRQIPRSLLRAANRQYAPARKVLACLVGIIGWLALAWFVFLKVEMPDWKLDGGRAKQVDGRVTEVRKVERPDGRYLGFAFLFDFQTPGGEERNGVSYASGQPWAVGAKVMIEYLAADPGVARISGSRTNPSQLRQVLGVLAVLLLLLLLTLVTMLSGICARRRVRWLLVYGTRSEALVQSVEPTSSRINFQTIHRITLRLTGADRNSIVQRRHQTNLVRFYQARFGSQQPLCALYDPAKPKRAIFPETLLLK